MSDAEREHHDHPPTQTIRDYIPTRRDISLAQWQRLLGAVTFGAALGLMAASYVSLHWALYLVTGNAVVAYSVPVVLEAGMAATAAIASTTRKDNGGTTSTCG